jgi:hypothetical protein
MMFLIDQSATATELKIDQVATDLEEWIAAAAANVKQGCY